MVNYYQQNARWTEGWMATGICARGIIPLGLSHDTKVQAGKSAIRISILPAPANDREREERRILMYYIMGIDAIASASSGWSNSVQYDELVSFYYHCTPVDVVDDHFFSLHPYLAVLKILSEE